MDALPFTHTLKNTIYDINLCTFITSSFYFILKLFLPYRPLNSLVKTCLN